MSTSRTTPFVLSQYLGKDLTVRWIIGETPANPLRGIGYELLEQSLRLGKCLFPNARRIVCISDLKLGYKRVEAIAAQYKVECLHISQMVKEVPVILKDSSMSYGFWKFLPLRTTRTGFDLILDNEVLLWRLPAAIASWLYNGGVVSIGGQHTNGSRRLGIYESRIDRIQPGFSLNNSMVGFGIGCTSLPLSLQELDVITEDHDANGWMSYNFAAFQGAKNLIPSNVIPRITEQSFSPLELIANCDGIHFDGHNFGESRLYKSVYERDILDLVDYCEYLAQPTP